VKQELLACVNSARIQPFLSNEGKFLLKKML